MLDRRIHNTADGYRPGGFWLPFFSTPFIVWQMGILFFSGTTMSLFGRTPVPLTQADTSLVIAAGYLASILALSLFPRRAVWMERVLLPLALAATALMLLPLPPAAITALFYVEVFCCVFSIGGILTIASQQLALDFVWRDGILSMAVGGVLIALLQNEGRPVSFTAFTLVSILLLSMQTAFYWRLPAKLEARYAGRDRGPRMPGILFVGIWLIITFSTLLICLASSFAESVPGGVSILYLAAAGLALLLWLLRRRLGVRSVRVFGGFFAVAVFGFVLAYLSLSLPVLRVPALLLLGMDTVLANLWMYFSAVSFRVYPLGWVGALGAGVGLALALLHAGLLELLRENLPLLYGIYAALSVALLLVYVFLEPYFTHAWGKLHGAEAAPAVPIPPAGKIPLAGEIPPARETPPARVIPTERVTESQPPEPAGPLAVLSQQERILARLILDGHTETSAAKAMNISLNTQKSYRKNLYAKLDVHSKRELFALLQGAPSKVDPPA